VVSPPTKSPPPPAAVLQQLAVALSNIFQVAISFFARTGTFVLINQPSLPPQPPNGVELATGYAAINQVSRLLRSTSPPNILPWEPWLQIKGFVQ